MVNGQRLTFLCDRLKLDYLNGLLVICGTILHSIGDGMKTLKWNILKLYRYFCIVWIDLF